MVMTPAEFAKHFDMAVLAQDTQEAAIREACRQAREKHLAAMYTTPCWTRVVAEELAGSDVLVGVGIAFPYGTLTSAVKKYEIADSLDNGATTVDMVINIGALKDGNLDLVREEVADLVAQCDGRALSKVIYEVGFLTDEETETLTEICVDAGADYVKTATGSEALPTEHHLRVMKRRLGGKTKLKLSGVPRQFTLAATLWMLDMGVDLIGTRSAPRLVEEYQQWLEEKSG